MTYDGISVRLPAADANAVSDAGADQEDNLGGSARPTWSSRRRSARTHEWLTPERRRALRHGLLLAAIVATVAAAASGFFTDALDARAYWAARAPDLYGGLPGTHLAYLYSPAFAQLIAPLQWLPEEVFVGIWLVAIAVGIAWLAGPRFLPLAIVVAWSDLHTANIHTFLAVAIVLGFRFPASWAFVVLTKVTPGVGLLWFVRRREWRPLLTALAATLAIVAVSFVADPNSWFAWFDLLGRSSAAPALSLSGLTPLWVRLPVAGALVWWGAGRDSRWTVPVGAMLALPVIWPLSLAMLLAVVPLARERSLRSSWRSALA